MSKKQMTSTLVGFLIFWPVSTVFSMSLDPLTLVVEPSTTYTLARIKLSQN